MPDDVKISELTALAEVPANDDVLALVDTSATTTKKIAAQYMRALGGLAIVLSQSPALAPFQAFCFTDTTARALTFTGTPAYGWLIVIVAQAAATTHTAQLPSGVTWDGTNRTANFADAGDVLIAMATSATRYQILLNTGVTFSA